MKKLFLIDTSSLFFRAFFAIGPLTSPSGMPTNAIYGFLSMLLKLLKEEKPEYLVFCYDQKEPSFRKEIYSEYKAHRSEMPEDLAPQIPYIYKLAEAMGIPSVQRASYEADDLIGTLTQLGKRHGMEVNIVSGDKDFAQLLTPHIYIYDTMKNVKIGAKEALEKWGVTPAQFIDFLALCGDSSDNIPGVSGIGPKTAQKLIADFGDLEGIYKNIDKVAGKSAQEKLRANHDNAFLSKKLVTIVTDIDLPDDLSLYRRKAFNRAELQPMLQELNFKNIEKNIWEADFDPGVEHVPSASTSSITTGVEPTTPKSAKTKKSAAAAAAAQSEQTELDFDRPEAQPESSEVLLDTASLQKHFHLHDKVWILEIGENLFLASEKGDLVFQIPTDNPALTQALQKLELKWMGYDLKSAWHPLQIKNPNCYWDSLLANYVLNPGESTEFVRVMEKHLGQAYPVTQNAKELLSQQILLKAKLQAKVGEAHFDKVLEDLDFPICSLLYKMENHGIKIDIPMLQKQSAELGAEIQETEKSIFELAGTNFNIASPKQLSQILFERLQLPSIKKTKTGFSTDNDVLEKLKSKHAVVEYILKFRELSKLKSTYVDPLPEIMGPDGRVHTHLNQALTTTGRLSSSNPNLQNIPIRTPRGARIRDAFCAEKGKLFLSADYSQIELRILAHYSDDKNMKQAFMDDIDIHTATASEIFSVKLGDVTGEMRRTAKAVNFGIAYGQGAFGLAETLGISRTESSDIIKRYFTRFSGIKEYMDSIVRSAKENGYVETLYGRRRYIKELQSSNMAVQKFGERAAINAPIQGTASDIVKKAMLVVDEKINLQMVLQVHDELILEGTPEQIHSQKDQVQKIMEDIVQLKVPLKVNVGTGPNWGEAH